MGRTKMGVVLSETEADGGESYVDRIYERVRLMALAYELRPGERVNETILAKQLNVSRTPLREALNRLRTEGFLEIRTGKGFFRRELDPREVYELYQLRSAVECAGARLAVQHATDAELAELIAFLKETGGDAKGMSTAQQVKLDEQFHETLIKLSRNTEMLRVLQNVNARIRFVRWIQMGLRGRRSTQGEHMETAKALKERDAARCVAILERHIDRRLEEITTAIREGYSRIYMGESPKLEG